MFGDAYKKWRAIGCKHKDEVGGKKPMSKRMQQWLAKKNKKQPEAEMGGLDGSDTVPSIYKEGEADETVLKLAGVYK